MINLAVIIPEELPQDNSSVIIDTEKPYIYSNKFHRAEVFQIDDYRKTYFSDELEVIKYIDDLSEKSKEILGENGVHRFNEYLSYDKGWDSGRGEYLSKQSIAILDSFINSFEKLKEKEPSIFLTRSGNLQLGWEDKFDKVIEIEFFPNKIEYYIESNNEEGDIDFTDYIVRDIKKFVERLSSEL
jgi:hypothetical protein